MHEVLSQEFLLSFCMLFHLSIMTIYFLMQMSKTKNSHIKRIFTTLHKISNFAPAWKIASFFCCFKSEADGCQIQYFKFIPAICFLIHFLAILHVAIYVLAASLCS